MARERPVHPGRTATRAARSSVDRRPRGRERCRPARRARDAACGRRLPSVSSTVSRRVRSIRSTGRPSMPYAESDIPNGSSARSRIGGIGVTRHSFPDHHPFRPPDIDFGDDTPVLMTEKDAVKCERFCRRAPLVRAGRDHSVGRARITTRQRPCANVAFPRTPKSANRLPRESLGMNGAA